MKNVLVTLFFAFKNNKQKLRLVLVNLNGLTKKIVLEDSFIGLEMEA